MMSKALDTALEELLAACAASSDSDIKILAERVQGHRKPRGRGKPKAVLPTPEEATVPGRAEAFVAWHSLPPEHGQPKIVWSETEVCRLIAKTHGVSSPNTVKPLVRAIYAQLTPPKPLDSSLFGQLTMAQKSVK
jgi:hypothetical protein